MTQGWLEREEERLVWIFGSSRSGSTWLLHMLADIDGVVPIDDPHLGHHLGVWRPIPLAWAEAGADQPELEILTSLKRDKPSFFFSDRYRRAWAPPLRDLITSRFQAQADDALSGRTGPLESGRPMVVVKEPGSQAADLLVSLFPRSRLIFLLRDGRDVVDSWLDAYQRGSWALREGAFPVSGDGRLALIRWLASVWAYRTEVVWRTYRDHDQSRRLLVRYEDLLSDTEGAIARVLDSLQVQVPTERRAEIIDAHSAEVVPADAKGPGRFVRSARPGGWRENMTEEEQQAMHAILGQRLSEFGYLESPLAAVNS